MTWDPVPWFVGGGAVHSPEVARALAYAATNGKEGVVLPGDLRVHALAVPGQGVQVDDGGAYILSRAAGQNEQTYVGRNPTADTIAITPTGSTGKSVLIGVRVEDPSVAGEPWADPSDPAKGPYIFTRAINCPAGTTSWQSVSGRANDTALALARIDMPPNTGTITDSMVTNLRSLANPRSERVIVKGTIDGTRVTLTKDWKAWPIRPIGGIWIPWWATHATIRMDHTIRFVSGSAYAQFQGFMGPAGRQDSTTLYGDQLIDSTSNTGEYRQPFIVPSDGYFPIPAAYRSTTAQLSFRAKAATTANGETNEGGVIGSSVEDYYFADITFSERTA